MEKMARAKKTFYDTLKRNGITVEEYVASPAGLSILKKAAELLPAEKSAGASNSILSMLEFLTKKTPASEAARGIVGGALGGYVSGAGLGHLTSPSSTSIGNLQKQEQIAEYDTAITELRNRMEAKAV